MRAYLLGLATVASVTMGMPRLTLAQQLDSAAAGVVHPAPPAELISAAPAAARDTTDGPPPTRAGRIIAGGMLGVLSGVLVTTLVYQHCEARATSAGEREGCGLSVAVAGPPAVLLGGVLGVIIADW